MKAQVVAIESGTQFVDGEERLGIRFVDADNGFSRIRLRRGVIDTTHSLKLDAEIELTISADKPEMAKMPLAAEGKEKAKGVRHES